MLSDFVFVYLDDILIFSPPDLDTHVQHVRQVLQRLLYNELFVKAEKCEVHVNSISFLAFTGIHIQMDPSRVSAVSDWPTPTSRKQLQCFLGFANLYRRSVTCFNLTQCQVSVKPLQHSPYPHPY